MKEFSSAAMAAIEAGAARVSGAVRIDCLPDPVCLWGGYGDLEGLDGCTFTGIGDRGLVSETGSAIGGQEQNVTLELSGIETAALKLFDATILRRAPVVVYRLIFDQTGTILLDASIFQRGRLDQIPVEETPGGTATIRALVEGAVRGMGRSGGRMRTDADQRLIDPNDDGLKGVSYAGQVMLYFGGKPPQAAASIEDQNRAAAKGALDGFFGGSWRYA